MMEKWDAGQAIVLPHSLKMVARAKLTLPKPSARAADGGGQGGDTGFFPLPFFVGAIAMGRGEVRDWVENRSWSSSGGRIEGARATEKGTAVYDYGSA